MFTVPSNYNYLEDKSTLKSIVRFLHEAGKAGAGADADDDRLVTVTLRALVHGTSQALPPLNWASLLSPLMRLSSGELITTLVCDNGALLYCVKEKKRSTCSTINLMAVYLRVRTLSFQARYNAYVCKWPSNRVRRRQMPPCL